MTQFQKYMRLLALGMSFSGAMALPYIHYKFYDTMLEVIQSTNTELGMLLLILTVTVMIAYVPMGIIADKTSPTKLIIVCTLGSAFFNTYFAFHHTYAAAMVIWGFLGITANGFWPALIKMVRDTGSSEEQGRMFGIFYAANGLTASALGVIDAWVFSTADNNIDGFIYVLYVQAAFLIIAAVLTFFFVKDETEFNKANKDEITQEKSKSFEILKQAFSLRATWLMTGFVFCAYGVFLGVSYMTPYTTNVLGVSLTFGAILGTIRQYFLRVLVAPAGGYLIDKIGSSAKVLSIAFVVVIALLLLLLSLPPTTAVVVFIIVIMLFSSFGQVIYTLMFSALEEVKIPPHLTATAVSLISVLGYTPDALFPPLFGYWLDTYGMKEGYIIIFSFIIFLSVLSILFCWRIIHQKKKNALANT